MKTAFTSGSQCLPKGACALLGLLVLTACVMVPVTQEVYDPDCRTMRRQIVLEPQMIGQFNACVGRDCSGLLVALGAVTAASLVVSGSIAVVGNVANWVEHRAQCKRADAASAPGAGFVLGRPGAIQSTQPLAPPTLPASSTSRAPAPP
jgi:hypothetical protein